MNFPPKIAQNQMIFQQLKLLKLHKNQEHKNYRGNINSFILKLNSIQTNKSLSK